MGCRNCPTHIQRKKIMVIGRFPGRIFISFEAVLVFHRKNFPSGRNLFNAVVETSFKMTWGIFWGDIFWDHLVILKYFWNMSGTKWTFGEKFCLSCRYGLLHDHRNISKDETFWKKINLSSFTTLTGRFSQVWTKTWWLVFLQKYWFKLTMTSLTLPVFWTKL